MDSLIRELRFALRDPVVVLTLTVGALLSVFTVFSGLKEVGAERVQIERVKQMVDEDRAYALADQSDAGSAAYYAFHFTYAPPSGLAFAARGVRDDLPWKHRIRMLALEGQIYETDAGNPETVSDREARFCLCRRFSFATPYYSSVARSESRGSSK